MGFTEVTYYFEGDSASDSDCTPAADENKPMLRSQVETDDISATVSTGAGIQTIFSWTTEPGDPGVKDMPSGDYTMSFKVTAVPSGCFYRGRWRIVDSSCSLLAQTFDASTQSGTKTYTYTTTFNPPAGDSGDRMQCILEIYFPSGTAGAFTIDVDDAGSYMTAPVGVHRPVFWLPSYRLRRCNNLLRM